jgi:cytochrome P450
MEKISKRKLNLRDIKKVGLTDPDLVLQWIDKENVDIFPFESRLANLRGYLVANPTFINQLSKFPSRESVVIRKVFKRVFGEYSPLGIDDQDVWKKDREAITVLFNPNMLKKFAAKMVKTIMAENESLKLHAQNGTAFNLNEYLTHITTDNVKNTLFGGSSINLRGAPLLLQKLFRLSSPWLDPFVKLFDVIPMPLYFTYKKYKNQLNSIIQQVIKEAFTDNISKEDHLVVQLAKAYGYQTYEQLDDEMKEHIANVITQFLDAAYDAPIAPLTKLIITWSLYPILMDNIADEIKTVIGSREPTYDDLKNLTYTNATIKEGLRLFIGGTLNSCSLLEDAVISGHPINKNDIIFIHKYATHRHPKYWLNPMGFNPSRFLKPLTDDQINLYKPFGLGLHSCPGSQFAIMEITLFIVLLLQQYRLELAPGSVEPHRKILSRVSSQKPSIKMKVFCR